MAQQAMFAIYFEINGWENRFEEFIVIMMSSSQFYGAGDFLINRGKLLPNCSWTHGVIFGYLSAPLIITREDSAFSYHLVTDENQGSLAREMFSNVEVVGLPFAHALLQFYDPCLVRNINRLFLSVHSLARTNETPLDVLVSRAINEGCDALILPGKFFEAIFGVDKLYASYKQIKVVKGAYAGDSGSYRRIISIFSRTKVLVTDSSGSHLFYASLCGCKVSVNFLPLGNMDAIRKVTLGGLIEPWKSSLIIHFNGDSAAEVKAFGALDEASQHELSRDKVGMQFAGNLSRVRDEINNISTLKLTAKNAKLIRYKLESRVIERFRNLSATVLP
jgi:hypothetical protein